MSPLRLRPVAAAALSLAALGMLSACGRETAVGAGHPPDSVGGACGTHQAKAPSASQLSPAPPDSSRPSAQETNGVRITDPGDGARGCAGFQVTNHEDVTLTYTVTFGFRSASGGLRATATRVLAGVKPGRTVSGTLGRGDATASDWSRVDIVKVRSVPTAEAPAPGGPCPASGTRLYADDGDAAMGLRVVTLHLENCGSTPYHLANYPRISPLGLDHRAVPGIRILHGGSAVAQGTGADGPARPLTLVPGERAHAGLVWRNTVLAGTPVNAPYVRVWAKQGARPVTVTPELDLGTTGKLAIGPWKRDG
ncbi:DUF4232 domain-containing protein [Streptomyces sp. NPDC047028]|uniref:DUF4232 domain-containing protein n=1 Tax=Streptomyces sp. NPDC047028 TaxID=3155793 RepID=UPI0033F0349E